MNPPYQVETVTANEVETVLAAKGKRRTKWSWLRDQLETLEVGGDALKVTYPQARAAHNSRAVAQTVRKHLPADVSLITHCVRADDGAAWTVYYRVVEKEA